MAIPPETPHGDAPVCPACGTPIAFKDAAILDHGELVHTTCRGRLTRRQAVEDQDRAARIVERAEWLLAEAGALRSTRCLVVVAWSHRHIAAELQRRFGERATILVDRRNRPGVVSRIPELGPERRRPLTPPEVAMWRDFGFRLIYRVHD
jgi:hypothetical protein